LRALITGSAGLIGSQAAQFFHNKGYYVVGIDNDMRSYFFGKDGSNSQNLKELTETLGTTYSHHSIDIRDYQKLEGVFKNNKFDVIIHTAAQPSHDWAAKEPITDFHVNAVGTFNLLELTRLYNKDATFIFTSTNKVYGDRPNFSFESGEPDADYKHLFIEEESTRYEGKIVTPDVGAARKKTQVVLPSASIDETMSIDQCKHSIFGASKVAADIMCQEYGRYFGMNVGIFRGGCLTGSSHSGVELHGFLSYLVKCVVADKPYKVFGYKGKQVRDNIEAEDLIEMFWYFHQSPRQGEVYNAGGGSANSISVLEAIQKTNEMASANYTNFTVVPENRIGDHIWYVSDLSKFQSHYPEWKIKRSLNSIIERIIKANHDNQH
jgi:CDP-paratose 2-epimerase